MLGLVEITPFRRNKKGLVLPIFCNLQYINSIYLWWSITITYS